MQASGLHSTEMHSGLNLHLCFLTVRSLLLASSVRNRGSALLN